MYYACATIAHSGWHIRCKKWYGVHRTCRTFYVMINKTNSNSLHIYVYINSIRMCGKWVTYIYILPGEKNNGFTCFSLIMAFLLLISAFSSARSYRRTATVIKVCPCNKEQIIGSQCYTYPCQHLSFSFGVWSIPTA